MKNKIVAAIKDSSVTTWNQTKASLAFLAFLEAISWVVYFIVDLISNRD